MPQLSDEMRYRLLSFMQEHPTASQRELATELGISVGKVNYCIRALVDKGLLRVRNFRSAKKKLGYVYKLTPKGLEEKVNVTIRFLRRKIAEYDALSAEIQRLSREVSAAAGEESRP